MTAPATVDDQIAAHIAGQPLAKRQDLLALHDLARRILPDGKLWFLDGRNAAGKIVTNPNIGYGSFTRSHADGSTREFYKFGLAATGSGISLYIMTFDDKTHLARTYGPTLGKAKVTGYCISFRALTDLDLATLEAALRDGAARPRQDGPLAAPPRPA